jgi:hypothetical protein
MRDVTRRAIAYAAAGLVAAAPALVFAAGSRATFVNPISAGSIPELLSDLLKFFVRVATVLCVLYLVWSGFLFVKAQGNEQELKKAKQAFFYALVGTLLMLGAEAIADAIAKTVDELQG